MQRVNDLACVLMVATVCCYALNVAGDISRYPDNTVVYSRNIVAGYSGEYEGVLPIYAQLGLDPSFDDQQQRILEKAMQIVVDRALTKRVLDCSFSHAWKDMPESRSHVSNQLYSALSPLPVVDVFVPSFAFVARYWNDRESVGLGYVGLFYDDDRPFPGFSHRHYLHLAINSDCLGEKSNYFYRSDEAYWAGVIAHEFLHNLGYRHPTGYEGSFINEYGRCIRSNGAEAALLEGEILDKEIERDL